MLRAPFSLELSQAINDWQRGGDRWQRSRRGLALKGLAGALGPQFRRCDLVCFRQIALDKSSLWKLGDSLHLKEEIAAWTLNVEVAPQAALLL